MSFARLLAGTLLLFSFSVSLLGQETDQTDDTPASRQSITSLPEIPRAIHDAMQSRDYGEAVKLIETELGKQDTTELDYLLYLQGVAHTESKQYDA
ncbi:MAG: hypothetical protein AAGI63_06875, partial [Planctomycetota bacterium]